MVYFIFVLNNYLFLVFLMLQNFFYSKIQGAILYVSLSIVLCASACTVKKSTHTNGPIFVSHTNCLCPGTDKSADTTIILSTKKMISLCGIKSYSAQGTLFSGLSIVECNKMSPIQLNPTIAFLPKLKSDTLCLLQMQQLPMGEEWHYTNVSVLQQNLWFDKDTLKTKTAINTEFPKYSNSQILDIFEEYQKVNVEYNEQTILLMDKLFVSAISGNILAAKTFKNFEAKYKNLEGPYKSKYLELSAMLKAYFEAH